MLSLHFHQYPCTLSPFCVSILLLLLYRSKHQIFFTHMQIEKEMTKDDGEVGYMDLIIIEPTETFGVYAKTGMYI